MKARIKFRKYGVMRFIGHLDVMRFFQKSMRRAGIPIAFTGGYSPHMIMCLFLILWLQLPLLTCTELCELRNDLTYTVLHSVH